MKGCHYLVPYFIVLSPPQTGDHSGGKWINDVCGSWGLGLNFCPSES